MKLDASGTPQAAFTVGWQPTNTRAATKPDPRLPTQLQQNLPTDALSAYADGEPVTINGTPGYYSSFVHTLAWHDGSQTITVMGNADSWVGTWPDVLTEAQLLDIAHAVHRSHDGYTVAPAPEGFRLAGEQRTPNPTTPSSTTSYAHRLVYADGNGRGFAVNVGGPTYESVGASLAEPPARLRTVHGQPAVLTPFVNGGDGAGCTTADMFICGATSNGQVVPPGQLFATYLQWIERSHVITITGIGLDDATLVRIGQGLHKTSQEKWNQLALTVSPTPAR